ncbi:hypothetical protein [Celeribacter neptunius]|uniref:hypothetical protein n=1 Tax=Celeribacter neptunius TaxID=588602 RepID=UPI000B7CC17B|nr:hypothetical protein [Celeribacter neptunius]
MVLTPLSSFLGSALLLVGVLGLAAAQWGLPIAYARRFKAQQRPVLFFLCHGLLSCFAYFAILGATVGDAALPLIAFPILGFFSVGQILDLIAETGFVTQSLAAFTVTAVLMALLAKRFRPIRAIALLLTLTAATASAITVADHSAQRRISEAASELGADCLHSMSLWASAGQRLGTFTLMGELRYANRHATAWVGQTFYAWSYKENRFYPINTVPLHYKRPSACAL